MMMPHRRRHGHGHGHALSLVLLCLLVVVNHAFTSPFGIILRRTSKDAGAAGAGAAAAAADNDNDNNNNNVIVKEEDLLAELDDIITPSPDNSLATLCAQRNLPLHCVKNARDLASIPNSPIKPGILFRTGRVGDADEHDIHQQHLGSIRTFVDLRSPTELKDDASLMTGKIYENCTNLIWSEGRRGRRGKRVQKDSNEKRNRKNGGCVTELPPGVSPLKKKEGRLGSSRGRRTEELSAALQLQEGETLIEGMEDDDDDVSMVSNVNNDGSSVDSVDEDEEVDEEDEEDELCDLDCVEDDGAVLSSSSLSPRKERHFVSLMNEFKYVRGTVSKLRKRDLARALLKTPGAVVSKRVWESLKEPFLREINNGGLIMLNELLLRFGAPGIRYVLQLCADESRHPVAFYCTAGKDRTGMIAAIILSVCGASIDDIVEDYSLSGNVYAEMNDHQAMVGALSQRNLNPKTFLGAPPQVMRDTLLAMEQSYGSVEGYCDWIGFDAGQREKLRKAVMVVVPREEEDDEQQTD